MRIADMNWMQVEDYLRNDDRTVLPLGSTEQHGYLSLSVDSLLSERVALEAAEPLGVPVFPVVAYGLTPYFTAFPGSVTLRVETYMRLVRDILDSLFQSGFERIIFVNGHGGNSPADALATEWMMDHPGTRIKFHNWWNAPKTWAKVLEIEAEVLSIAAKKGDMPKFLAKENANQVPSNALLMSSLLVQAVLVATLFSADAFTFALSLCSHLSLLPYLLSAAFMLKLAMTRETYGPADPDHGKDMTVAILATIYGVFLVFAGGMKFLVLSFLIYAPGTLLYLKTRNEQGKQVFTKAEWIVLAVFVVGAVYALMGLITGYITI